MVLAAQERDHGIVGEKIRRAPVKISWALLVFFLTSLGLYKSFHSYLPLSPRDPIVLTWRHGSKEEDISLVPPWKKKNVEEERDGPRIHPSLNLFHFFSSSPLPRVARAERKKEREEQPCG